MATAVSGAAVMAATREAGVAATAVAVVALATVAALFTFRLVRRAGHAESLALKDALTGLPNRALLEDRLEQAVERARRTAGSFALMAIDLDWFKDVNDTRGHEAGDEVLRSIAHRLESAVRASDTVARVGGDEFIVLSLGTSTEDEAATLVGRLRTALREPHPTGSGLVEVGASIGWALFPGNGVTPQELLAQADVEMFATKRGASNDSTFARRSSLEAGIVRDFESALARNKVVVHYQPVLDLKTGIVHGAEALVRVHHPNRGLLAPAEFIPQVERTPLIRTLTLHVIAQGLRDAQNWSHEWGEVGISVNVPYRAIDDAELAKGILGLLSGTSLRPGLLTLEVIPSGPGAGAELDRSVLERLVGSGIRISLDDFGRASSLAALRVLPFAETKIDSQFVKGIGDGGANDSIVRNLLSLADDLGLDTVAVGVETQRAWNALAAMGCGRAQGFYAQPALPAHTFAQWLAGTDRPAASIV
ncbi:MAG: EAL domain-containing protein [Thermoleophilia bacterium]|nr:EAL domain-containing protein [Thermoleophilia bacterium]